MALTITQHKSLSKYTTYQKDQKDQKDIIYETHDTVTDVKEVYNMIAKDFDRTRYKIWKGVQEFIDSIPSASLVGDIGCGNGKNMLSRKDLNFKGCDISEEFVKICTNKKLDVIEGSILDIPFESNYFEYAVCIAVIHHLRTREERIKALSEIIRVLKPGGQVLIYVWSLNQDEKPQIKKKLTGDSQDQMIEFKTLEYKVYKRFYHMYKENEIVEELNEITQHDPELKTKTKIIKMFNDSGNECIVISKI